MTNLTYGYGRVSTIDQNLDDQNDALTAYGVDKIHVEKFTGTKASRPEWDTVRHALRRGDTLVVTKLDRLGRSLTSPRSSNGFRGGCRSTSLDQP